MSSVDKDLEALRAERQQLSAHMSRFALLALTLLFVAVVAFGRAYKRVDGEEVRGQVGTIARLAAVSQEPLRLSYVFRLLPETKVEDASNELAPEEQRLAAGREQRELERALEEQAREWFVVKPSFLGSSLELDLRYWLFGLPLFLWFVGARLAILSKKEALIRMLLALRLERSAEGGTTMDRLLVGGGPAETPFARYPARLEIALGVAAAVTLLVYLVATGWPFWTLWGTRNIAFIAGALGAATLYVVAFCRLIGRRLEEQLAAVEPSLRLRSRTDETWMKLQRLGARLVRPLSMVPRTSLVSGSLLVLLSLFLVMGQSCDSDRGDLKGYELLAGDSDDFGVWFTVTYSDMLLVTAQSSLKLERLWVTATAQLLYLAGLAFAVVTPLLVAMSRFRPGTLSHPRRLRRLSAVAVWIAFFALGDLGFVHWTSSFASELLSFNDGIIQQEAPIFMLMDLARVVYWVVPAVLWCRFAGSARDDRRARWPGVRSALVILYLPAVLSGPLAVIDVWQKGFTGVPAYVLGAQLLALGTLELWRRAREGVEAEAATAATPETAQPPPAPAPVPGAAGGLLPIARISSSTISLSSTV